MKIPFSNSIMTTVLAFVLAAGGSYGGYKVLKDDMSINSLLSGGLYGVAEVVDGDTIVLENGDRVRFLTIDAPEKSVCYGEEAKGELTRLVLGSKVELRADREGDDNYGRLLRYVFVPSEYKEGDAVFVNKEMVSGGFAEVAYVKPNKQHLAELQAAEREAQSEKVGMWGECDVAVNRHVDRAGEREMASETFDKECVIKGNINKSYGKDYFVPGCPNYKVTKIDPRKSERWFCSEEEAKEAGWQMSAACGNIHQFKD